MRILNFLIIILIFTGPSIVFGESPPEKFGFLKIEEIKEGEDCFVWTTLNLQGTKKYSGKVKGVLKNAAGPKYDLILTEIFGKPFAGNGIYAGQSGTPVFVKRKGKWFKIGTISFANLFAKKALAYLRPVYDVLWAKYDTSATALPKGKGISFGENNLKHLAIPISVSNLNEELFKEIFGDNNYLKPIQYNKVITAGVKKSENNSEKEKQEIKIKDGDVLAVQLLWGDFDFAGYGTVSHIDGNEIWMFGHPMVNLGPVEYRLAKAKVLDSQSSYMFSHIIPQSTDEEVGVITQDRETGIYGVLGKSPRKTIPIIIKLTTSDGFYREIKFTSVHNAWWTPRLIPYAVFNTAVSYVRNLGDITIFETDKIIVSTMGKNDTLISSEAYTSSFGLDGRLYFNILNKIQSLMNNPYTDVRIQSIEYSFKVFDEQRERTISKSYFVDDKPGFLQGDSTILKIILTQPRKDPLILDFPFKIPKDVQDGKGKIIVGNASAIQNEEGLQRGGGSLKDLFDNLKSARREDAVYVYVVYPPYPLAEEKSRVTSKGFKQIAKRFASNIEEYELPIEGFSIKGETTVLFRVGKNAGDDNPFHIEH